MKFIKRHILAFIISTVAVVVLAVGVIFWWVNFGNIVYVDNGGSARLEKGQILKMRGVDDVSATITEFHGEGCPKNVDCIWSGLKVDYELVEGGKKYTNSGINSSVDGDNYRLSTVDTDYKTYSIVRLQHK